MAVEIAQHYPRVLQDLAGSDRAPAEGPRTVENSPEYFPHLGIPGCKFLHGVATVAHSFEIDLLRLPPHPHIPSSIQRIVDVSEAIIQRKERKDSKPVISPPSYSLRSIRFTTNPQNKTTVDINPHEIETLEMIFASNGSSSSRGEVKIYLCPNTRRVYEEPGYRFLEGLPRDEARKLLSSRSLPAEEVAQVLDSYAEAPAAFRIKSDGAELEIIFTEGQVVTATRKSMRMEPILTSSGGLAFCRLSITAAEAKGKEITEIPLPLSDFCGTRVLKSQEEIEKWLGEITLDLANRAKPGKG